MLWRLKDAERQQIEKYTEATQSYVAPPQAAAAPNVPRSRVKRDRWLHQDTYNPFHFPTESL